MRIRLIVAAISLATAMNSANAAGIVNGNFEAGDLTGWTVGVHAPDPMKVFTGFGDNTIAAGGPAGSTKYGRIKLTNGEFTEQQWLDAWAEGKKFAFGPDISPKFEQSFSGNAGSILSFDVKWLVSGFSGGGGFDIAVIGPNGNEFAHQQMAWLYPINVGQPSSDWQTLQHSLQSTGDYTFRITPISTSGNPGSPRFENALVEIGLDNLTLTTIPEPATISLAATGLACACLIAARRKYNRRA